MSTAFAPLEAAARDAGLTLTPLEPGTDFTGQPTVRASIARTDQSGKAQTLELSQAFDAANPKFASVFAEYFAEAAQRLRNPRPDCFLTTLGIPLSFGSFAWPFHASTSGADTFILHGEIRLEDGAESILHAKVSASLTRTFADVMASLEQPFAEGFVYNAVRKTLDQGQLELVKSGNRQPVPVTTRYYSSKQAKFIFNDTDQAERRDFLAGKVFWLSHVLGGEAPVWIADPRDAQYLNTTVDELNHAAQFLESNGLVTIAEKGWATPTEKLHAERERFVRKLEEGLNFTRPSFNEDMRAGHTNM